MPEVASICLEDGRRQTNEALHKKSLYTPLKDGWIVGKLLSKTNEIFKKYEEEKEGDTCVCIKDY